MATSTNSASPKSGKHGSLVAGRSAATGRFVLSPASKGSSITVREVRRAAEDVQSKKK
jgi:hypothetical protein